MYFRNPQLHLSILEHCMSYQISLTVGYPEIFDNKSVSIKYFDVEFTKKIRGDRNGEVEVVTRHASQIGKQLSFEYRIKLESGIYYREKFAKIDDDGKILYGWDNSPDFIRLTFYVEFAKGT